MSNKRDNKNNERFFFLSCFLEAGRRRRSVRLAPLCGRVFFAQVVGIAAVAVVVVVTAAVDLQSSRVLVLERLDYAMSDLVFGHFAQRFQFRFGRLPQPAEHFHGLPVFGRTVSVARPPSSLHLYYPRQRGRRLVVGLPSNRLLLAVDHHPRRSLRIARLPRRHPQVGS